MTKQEQFAYCAGLLDGEGCFHASRNEHCNTFRYGITVNLDFDKPLLRLKGLFGGEVKPRSDGGFCWAIPKHLLSKCLDVVIPFLLVKREQAELLRELRVTFVDTDRKRGQAPPSDVVEIRQKLTDRITLLKDDYSMKTIPVFPKACIYAYSAGLLDAEGCFGIYRAVGNKYCPKVQIGMCDPTPVAFVASTFNGFVQSTSKNHKSTVHYAVFDRSKAADIAKRTKPYRLLKIEQGDLVVRLYNHISLWQSKRGGGSVPYPAKVNVQRERWYQRSRALNSLTLVARAETNPSQPNVASDSPTCIEPKDAELAEMSSRYAVA